MSEQFEAIYYDGLQARPHPVYIHFQHRTVKIYNYQRAVIVEKGINQLHIEETANQLYIYMDSMRSSFVVLPPHHALMEPIKLAFSSSDSSWFNTFIRQKWSMLLIILAGLTGIFYLLAILVLPALILRLVTAEHEALLGKEIFESSISPKEIDSVGTKHLQQFADAMNLSKTYRLKTYLVQNPDINAYAMPGGYIVVNTGLLRKMQTYEELAALLGHEVTHINERHTLKSMVSTLSIGLIVGILTGDVNGSATILLHNAEKLRQLSFSRSLEEEADEKGFEIMIRNKINPQGMIHLMEMLKKEEAISLPRFLSSHPLTEDRIKNARERCYDANVQSFPTRYELHYSWNALSKR
jgi:Zn-dependent protease with chaperone function